MIRILHVTEAFNGGIVEVLENITRDCPDQFHYILFSSREYDPKPFLDNFCLENVELIPWTGNLFRKRAQLWEVERRIRPHVIHLHSSIAGVIGRLRFSGKPPVIYSPHGFSFQKRDTNTLNRTLYWSIEYFLQIRTTRNVAFWPIESVHFKYLGGSKKTSYCPLLIQAYSGATTNRTTGDWSNGELKILGVGRLTTAKDPEFFLETVNLIRKKLSISAKWVGDGDESTKVKLMNGEIDVTGWVPKEQVAKEILESDILLVTSWWDAGPATVFDAIYLGTPVLSRTFPASKLFSLDAGDSPEELVAEFLTQRKATSRQSLVDKQRTLVKETIKEYNPTSLRQCYVDLAFEYELRRG